MMDQWHNELTPVLPLDGEWAFTLGEARGSIQVPGAWEAQGYSHQLEGPAVYQRRVSIPQNWAGGCIQLQFDAVSYHVEVEVNGVTVSEHIGLWTPFAIDVTSAVRPGQENDLRLTIYKPGERFPMRESLAGFLPDVCIPFGGVWQPARLAFFPTAAVSNLRLTSDPHSGAVMVQAATHQADGLKAVVRILTPDGHEAASWQAQVSEAAIEAGLSVDPVQLWHPAHPALYTAELTLRDATGTLVTRVQKQFGFRSLSRDGDQLMLNNQPYGLRGVLNWGWYPEILCPAPDAETIRDEFRRVREYGYNMVKLCLYVPSPLYFEIADEEGMLLWLELPLWLPKVSERLRQQAPVEYADILAAVNHHPSIVIYSLGCELGSSVDDVLLGQLNDILRTSTQDVLACDNSGSGEAYGGLAFDFADFNDYHFYCDLHNFNPLMDHFRRDWRPARPWIFGEFCDADDYRDLGEVAAANHGELHWWLLEQNPIHAISVLAYSQQSIRMPKLSIPFDGQALQRLSRQQSFVIRKSILEKVRARASMGGYIVTSIRETPLATSSMFDDFGRGKYDPQAFREFNSDAVLVLEQGRARVWKYGGDRPAPIDRNNHETGAVMDFRVVLSQSAGGDTGGALRWRLQDDAQQVLASGRTLVNAAPASHIPHQIANLQITAPETTVAREYKLVVELDGGIHNQWPLWVYPAVNTWPDSIAIYDPAGRLQDLDDLVQSAARVTDPTNAAGKVLITSVFTAAVATFVEQGGRAILLQAGDGGLPAKPCPFWREAIKLLYDHPVLKQFPQQGFADMQFYHLATDSALDTAYLESWAGVEHIQPIIRRLDARQFTLLDYLTEIHVGAGRLMATTLRFGSGTGDQVNGLKANIAARHLLYLMLQHVSKTE